MMPLPLNKEESSAGHSCDCDIESKKRARMDTFDEEEESEEEFNVHRLRLSNITNITTISSHHVMSCKIMAEPSYRILKYVQVLVVKKYDKRP